MGARTSAVVLACLLVLMGCTDGRPEATRTPNTDGDNPTASPTASRSDTPKAAFVGPDSSVVQHLWRPIESLTPLRTNLPPILNFATIRQSPLLTTAPVGPAVLAVDTDPRPYNVGDPAVVNAAGEWRVIERDALGMRNPDNVEQQFELSPDGSTLALGDRYGIVFLDLTTGAWTRVRIGVQEPVIHAWTTTGDGVVITRRGIGDANEAWEVRADDGTVLRAPFDPWWSSMQRDGSVAELAGSSRRCASGGEGRSWTRSLFAWGYLHGRLWRMRETSGSAIDKTAAARPVQPGGSACSTRIPEKPSAS